MGNWVKCHPDEYLDFDAELVQKSANALVASLVQRPGEQLVDCNLLTRFACRTPIPTAHGLSHNWRVSRQRTATGCSASFTHSNQESSIPTQSDRYQK